VVKNNKISGSLFPPIFIKPPNIDGVFHQNDEYSTDLS